MDTQIGAPPPPPADQAAAPPPRPDSATSAFSAATEFLRQYWLRVLAISAALTIPCFWQRRIEAGDLASHVYNVWLAQLIERGQAPGLWIARQWNNVLFDIVMLKLGNVVGLGAAQKIVVPAMVLLFFWGAFALVCAVARPKEIPWSVLPCLAIFAYGWTFEMGFMNYYLSIGLAFFALALLRRGRGKERILSVALAPLIWLAHPLGLLLLIGAGAYMLLAEHLAPRWQALLFLAAAAVITFAHFYIIRDFDYSFGNTAQLVKDGTDQLLLYGPWYLLAARLLETTLAVVFALNFFECRRTPGWWLPYLLPLQFFGLLLLAAAVIPTDIRVPQYDAPLGLMVERMTSLSAVLLCCLLGLVRPRKWHLACFAAIAVLFFSVLYRDDARLNRMEQTAERLVHVLPPGQRVLATIWRFPGTRVFIHHMVDRACIAQCFSYENYEPSSGQFRVRATDGNPYVLDAEGSDAAQGGAYVMQTRDLPAFEIYQCNLNMVELCMRELAAGEANGAVGVQRPR
jgi:hypothetical protein